MSKQQTVLRVLTNIPNYDLLTTGGTISIVGQTGVTYSGSGTISNPYTGSSVGGQTIFKVNVTNGIFTFDMSVLSGGTQNIYVTHDNVETLQVSGATSGFTGGFDVSKDDQIRVVLTNIVTINSIYFTPLPTPVNKFENLDLYGDVPIKVNRSFAELQDIAKKNSDYTLSLSLPGSKKNNRFFENYYDVDTQSLYFSANNKTLCDVLINDESYFSGYMRLNNVKIMDGSVEYNVTLYSTVGNLFGDIGNNL